MANFIQLTEIDKLTREQKQVLINMDLVLKIKRIKDTSILEFNINNIDGGLEWIPVKEKAEEIYNKLNS